MFFDIYNHNIYIFFSKSPVNHTSRKNSFKEKNLLWRELRSK